LSIKCLIKYDKDDDESAVLLELKKLDSVIGLEDFGFVSLLKSSQTFDQLQKNTDCILQIQFPSLIA
jgi:hypothetical protein